MIKIIDIINELNLENGSNYKLAVLEKYKDNETFKQVLEMTYDKVRFTYGIKKIPEYTPESYNEMGRLSLEYCLSVLIYSFCTREVTGNNAISMLTNLLSGCSKEDAIVLERIIDRDLKINVGRTNINKVFSGLIVKPPYMRCDTYSKKNAKNINFPAIVQMKCDGTFRMVTVDSGKATFSSRSGEEEFFPKLEPIFKKLPDGVYIGELLIRNISDRSKSNGLINSDNPPHNDIYITCWDYITLQEFSNAKGVNSITYFERFENLKSIMKDVDTNNVEIVDYKIVNNITEALQYTSELMNKGFEGSVLKDFGNIFKDHTSKTQLKLKLEIELEMRITSFLPGNKGSKNENYFSAITFENDEGTIKGQFGVTSLTEQLRDELFEKKDSIIGRIVCVKCNDLTQAEGNDYFALSHPRYVDMRYDKDETDTLQRALDNKNMAMELS